MNRLSEDQLGKISRIVREVEKLSDIEKLFLYLQLPCGRAEVPEGANKYKSSNGNKCCDIFAKKPDQETTQTYTWILSHLEEDPNVSLPKQEVYDEYRAFCQANRFEPLCVADFGKAMKHAFPCIKPRRLGQRGNSRYCYSGLRKKYKIEAPSVPDIISCRIVDDLHLHQHHHQQQQQQPTPMNCCSNNLGLAQNHPNIKQEPKLVHEHHHPFNYDHSLDRTSSQLRNSYEAMNLKLEPIRHDHPMAQANSNDDHHHQHVQQQQTGNTYSNNNGNQHQHNPGTSQQQHHDMMPTPTHSTQLNHSGVASNHQHSNNNHQHQHQAQNYHQLTVPIRLHGHAAPPPLPPQQPSMPYSGQHYHPLQRSGTPDDDDYRHNYQDLHRPIVSAAIPFSQTMPAQMACIPVTRLPPGTPFDYPPASCCAGAQNGGEQIDTSQQQHPFGQPSLTGEDDRMSVQQQQHYDSTQIACNGGDPSQQRSNNNGAAEHVRTAQHHRPQAHHPQRLRMAPTHLHLNNTDEHHTSDLCASPFQSPASTPYPMIGSCGSAGSSTGGGGGLNSPYLTPPATSTSQQQPPAAQDYYSTPSTSTTTTVATTASAANDCVQYSSND